MQHLVQTKISRMFSKLDTK